MQYQIPQFIEVEDKIFGPLTFRQFVYLAGGAGIIVVLVTALPLFIAIMFAVPVAALVGALAFYKINDRPLLNTIESAVYYFLSNKLYLWRQQDRRIDTKKKEEGAPQPTLSVPTLSHSKLRDLAWSLDVKDSIYAETTQPGAARRTA